MVSRADYPFIILSYVLLFPMIPTESTFVTLMLEVYFPKWMKFANLYLILIFTLFLPRKHGLKAFTHFRQLVLMVLKFSEMTELDDGVGGSSSLCSQ